MRTSASAARVRDETAKLLKIERFAECLSHTSHENDRDAVALALLVEKRRLVQRRGIEIRFTGKTVGAQDGKQAIGARFAAVGRESSMREQQEPCRTPRRIRG